MKTLDECKSQVAKNREYSSIRELLYDIGVNETVQVLDEVAEFYKNQSIKRDPKVEKPPTNKDLLFTFKDGKSHIGMIPEYPDEELVYDSVYYGGYWTERYEDVEWWCFIEEIF